MSDGSGKVENREGLVRFIAYEGAAPFPLFNGRFDTRKAERENRKAIYMRDNGCCLLDVDSYTDSSRSFGRTSGPPNVHYMPSNILVKISNFGSLLL